MSGLHKQLDILEEICATKGLTVNVKKTKAMIFKHPNCKAASHSFVYAREPNEQVDEFKYLGALLHSTKGLTPAMAYLHKVARRAMFPLHHCCQQLRIHDPALKCRLFDTLVKPTLSYCCEIYCCEIWSVLGNNSALDDLERIELGFLFAWGSYTDKNSACSGRIWQISSALVLVGTISPVPQAA